MRVSNLQSIMTSGAHKSYSFNYCHANVQLCDFNLLKYMRATPARSVAVAVIFIHLQI